MNTRKLLQTIPNIQHLDTNSFFLISGPCAVENEKIVFETAEKLKQVCLDLQIPLIFKASYRKANRSRIDSFSGIGNEKALNILKNVKDQLNLAITTDIHKAEEAAWAAEVADILQIPAFLCRQTNLLISAAKTNKIVNIKKGQFLSPEAMQFAAQKVMDSGNQKVLLTERGTTFGYGSLVVDFRGIPKMQKFGHPVILDCTHSLQEPNQSSGVTGGQPKYIKLIAKAGIASGVEGLFIETHPNPSKALSDGANMLPLSEIEPLLIKLKKIHTALN